MSTEQIVALLTAERDRLNQAISLLGGTSVTVKRRGRPPGKKAAAKVPAPMDASAMPTVEAVVTPPARKKRKMSAEARARIAAAQKARWAAAKKKYHNASLRSRAEEDACLEARAPRSCRDREDTRNDCEDDWLGTRASHHDRRSACQEAQQAT